MPCSSRYNTIWLMLWAIPQNNEGRVKPAADMTKTFLIPKRVANQPTRAVMIAAALLLVLTVIVAIYDLRWGTVLEKRCQCIGYFASVLVLATFAMRNMHLLRITAILSNIAFITYGVLYPLPPIIGLHLLLLPINLVRLIELYRAGRENQRSQLPWTPRSVPAVLIAVGVVFACQLDAHAEGRAWVGVTIGDASPDEDLVKLGWFSGVPVLEVHADSPAASAGIRAGDIIVEIDGQSLVSANELICRIASRFPGSRARLTTVHGTEIRYISLKLGSWPDDSFPILLHCPPKVSWQPTLGPYSMCAAT
jgi:hypothetical protein